MFWFGKRRAKRITRKELNPAAAQKIPLQQQGTAKRPQEDAGQPSQQSRMQAETEALLTLLFAEQDDLFCEGAASALVDGQPLPAAPAVPSGETEEDAAQDSAHGAAAENSVEAAILSQIAVNDAEIAPLAAETGSEAAAEIPAADEAAEIPAADETAEPSADEGIMPPAGQTEAADEPAVGREPEPTGERAVPALRAEPETADRSAGLAVLGTEPEPAEKTAELTEMTAEPFAAEASANEPAADEAAETPAADGTEKSAAADDPAETPAVPLAPPQLAAALGSVFGTGQEEEARERLKRRDRRIQILWRALLGTAAALVLVAVGAAVWAVQAGWRLVVVREEGQMVYSGFSDDQELDAMLELSGLALNRGDRSDIRAEGLIVELSIDRAFLVTVTADGVTRELFLTEEIRTVEQLLSMAEIEVGEEDILNHALHDAPYSGMELVVQRVTRQEVTETAVIPAEAVVKQSPLLRVGKTLELLADQKRDGEKQQTFLETYVDGELQSRELLHEEVLREPVPSILLTGANVPASAINGARYTDVTIVDNAPTSYTQLIESEPCTAYSFDPGVWGASGMYLHQGFVAVDPDRIPLGSLLYITSPDGSFVYGWAIAADVCEAAVQRRVAVDCFFDTFRESQLFGRHTMNVYVVDQLTQADLSEYIAREAYFVKRIPA